MVTKKNKTIKNTEKVKTKEKKEIFNEIKEAVINEPKEFKIPLTENNFNKNDKKTDIKDNENKIIEENTVNTNDIKIETNETSDNILSDDEIIDNMLSDDTEKEDIKKIIKNISSDISEEVKEEEVKEEKEEEVKEEKIEVKERKNKKNSICCMHKNESAKERMSRIMGHSWLGQEYDF